MTVHPSQNIAPEQIAAVDLGSNSFHLVIARIVDGSLQLLHREKQRVLLAEGLDNDLVLSEDAIARGIAVLRQFAITLQGFEQSTVRVIATYTLRRAKNTASFLRQAQQVLPYPIEVISGQEEARFIYQGVAHFETNAQQRLVMDIGGGSTEFAIGVQFQPLKLSSRNMGCVNFGQQFFAKGKISPKRFERALLNAEQELESITASFKATSWQQAVGTSGTIKTIKDIVVGLGLHPHVIKLEHLLKLRELMLKVEHCDDLDLPSLTDDRKPLLAPGLAILLAAFQMLGIKEMLYVDAALREGVLYEMSDRLQHQDVRAHTILSLMRRYTVCPLQADRVKQTAQQLFAQVSQPWCLDSHWGEMLSFAADVFEVGLQINSSSVQRHSAYILTHANLPGFNQEQQRLLSTIVRFHRRKIKAEDIPPFYLFSIQPVIYSLVLFRLAVLLNQKRRDDLLPDIQLVASNNQLTLLLPESFYQQHSLLAADLATEQQFLRKIAFILDCPGLIADTAED